MCLQQVLEIPEKYKTGEHVGYKVLYRHQTCVSDGPIITSYFTPVRASRIIFDEWMINKNQKFIHLCTNKVIQRYKPGFHIFLNEEDAGKYKIYDNEVVVKVRFKDVVAYGLEYDDILSHSILSKVIVVKQMYIDKQYLPT